jgi:hypothetical protein
MNKNKTRNAGARLPAWNVSTLAAAMSLVLAAGASLFFAFYPVMTVVTGPSVTITANGTMIEQAKTRQATVLETEGWEAVPALTIPVLLAALPTFLRRTRCHRASRWGSAMGLVAFTVVGSLSVGLFYFPSALAMCLAAVCSPSESP